MWLIYLMSGVLITAAALWMLQSELNRAVRALTRVDRTSAGTDLDELNASFFEIANDLEGKYSVHEKQIAELESRLDSIQAEHAARAAAASQKPPAAPADAVKKTADPPQKLDKQQKIAVDAVAYLESGDSIQVAAKKLGVGVGELMLILGFYRGAGDRGAGDGENS